ncbi:MAG TPA: hypothetical protein VKQ72_08595 [Aggregatilineales bacterium]|nr:hypothetical protein [Aggregatilineales bacterium]
MTQVSLDPTQSNAALLFTNNAGVTVFADRLFLNLFNYSQSAAVIGKPLAKVLGIEERLARQLIDELRKAAQIEDRVLDARSAVGSALRLSCSGIASVDAAGRFIGADFRLREVEAISQETLINSPASFTLPVLPSEGNPEVDKMFLQLYFTTYTKALYVLLARLVGPQVQERLDKLINEVAKRNHWQVQMSGGLFTGDVNQTPVEAYTTILHEAQGYAENMIGKPMVVREVAASEAQLHPGVLSLASQYGLREIRNGH